MHFSGDVTLNGVTWEDPGAGEFRVYNATARLLGDKRIPTGITLMVENPYGGTAQLRFAGGEFTNDGTIQGRTGYGYYGASGLYLESDTALTGSGEIVLVDAYGAEISGAAGSVLTLGLNQTLRGSGQVDVEVVNEGSILGDGSNVLTLTQGVTNTGTITAANGGTLSLGGAISTTTDLVALTGGILQFSNATIANAGYTLTADGGTVELINTTVNGGTLLATDNAASFVHFSGDVTLNGVTWEDPGAGEFRVYNATARLLGDKRIPTGITLMVENPYGGTAQLRFAGGEFTNDGTIKGRTGYGYYGASGLYLESDTALTGSGEIVLVDAYGAEISGAAGSVLTLGLNQTPGGAGRLMWRWSMKDRFWGTGPMC